VLPVRRPWKITLVLFLAIGFGSRVLLLELNHFADHSTPSRETLVIESVGKYYTPFRVDYLSGRSELLRKSIDVPVLAEVAAQSKVGDHIDIAVGKGLFNRPWIFPYDKYLEYDTFAFKAVDLGVSSFLFAVLTGLYFFSYKRRYLTAKGIRLYFVALAVGACWFYATAH